MTTDERLDYWDKIKLKLVEHVNEKDICLPFHEFTKHVRANGLEKEFDIYSWRGRMMRFYRGITTSKKFRAEQLAFLREEVSCSSGEVNPNA